MSNGWHRRRLQSVSLTGGLMSGRIIAGTTTRNTASHWEVKAMATITITINVDSAAFEDGSGSEVASILRDLADKYDDSDIASVSCNLHDTNGHTVGEAGLSDD